MKPRPDYFSASAFACMAVLLLYWMTLERERRHSVEAKAAALESRVGSLEQQVIAGQRALAAAAWPLTVEDAPVVVSFAR